MPPAPATTAATNPFTISKSASPASLPNGGTATYTVLITNTSSFASSITRINDLLPTLYRIQDLRRLPVATSDHCPTSS